MKRVIKVFEHEKLYCGAKGDDRSLTVREWEKLCAYNDKHGHVYYTVIYKGVKFRHYVGVIRIGDLTIEILPKIDREAAGGGNEHEAWQKVLLRMLSVARGMRVRSDSEACLKRRYHSVLDMYFNLFLDEVEALAHRGLVKHYRKEEGNTRALKGRLVFTGHLRHNLTHQERFYTCHQTYDYDHLCHQVIQKALSVLSVIGGVPGIRDRINRLRLELPEISDKEITACDFERLRWNRKTEPYRTAIQIARMIILNYSPDIQSANEHMLALLFDMNKLWEGYVYHLLKRANDGRYDISCQQSQGFWEDRTIRPDIVVRRLSDDKRFVLDSKWKITTSSKPSDDDLKQMFVYNIYWEACGSVLLYPEVKPQPEFFGKYHKGGEEDSRCKVGFVNIFNSAGELDLEAGKAIFNKLE